LSLPEGYTSATIRCHWCDAAAEVPEYLRSTKLADVIAQLDEPAKLTENYAFVPDPEPEKPPPSPRKPRVLASGFPNSYRANFEAADNAGAPMLQGNQIETDDGPVIPYTVPGTGLKPCPECQGELPIEATFCVHCGTPLIGPDRDKVRRQYTPIDREWYDGWPPHFRKSLFLLLLLINAVLVLIGIIVRGDDLKLGSVWAENIACSIVPLFLQAFLLGTYGSLRVIRERDGHASVWRTWHFCFIPLRPKLLPLANCAGVGALPPAPGIAELFVCAVLFTMCILPGVIFLFMVILRERVNIELVNELRGKEATILRGKSVAEAQEIAKVVAEATGVTWYKVL
jgi:hypothetical protein